MNTEAILEYLKTADSDELAVISYAIKHRDQPERVKKTQLIRDDITRLSAALPRATTEHKTHKYEKTCAYFIRAIKDLTDVCLHSYAVHYSGRGYPVWATNETVSADRADAYAEVFHSFVDVLLDNLNKYGTTYNTQDSDKG